MEVFPIPPAPMRAMGVRFSVRPTIFSISSSRPKQALGGGGGDSPSTLDVDVRLDSLAVETADLVWTYKAVSIPWLLTNRT
jgi:hypothetical protein